MSGDCAPVGRREALGRMNDVEERLVNFPDVVKQRRSLDFSSLSFREPHRVGENQSIHRDATNVPPRLGVVRIDGVEKCLEGRGRETFGAFARAVLANHHGAGSHADRKSQS
jgi:hypothetical protein